MNNLDFLLKKKVAKTIEFYLSSIPEIDRFINQLRNSSKDCFIVGGFIRDILVRIIHERDISPRDIDIVVKEFDISKINEKTNCSTKRTPLGGFRIFFRQIGMNVDIWSLEKTIFFSEFGIKASLTNLLDGFPFDVERAAFNIKRKKIIDRGAIKAITLDRIAHNPFWIQSNRLHINAARAISIAQHTGMRLHSSVVDMIRSIEWMDCRDKIVNFFKKNDYTREQIDSILIKIKEIAEGDINGCK